MSHFKQIALVSGLIVLTVACNIEPFEGDIPEDQPTQLSCEQAAQNTNTAASNFFAASSTDSNYSELCNVYKEALLDQIDSCGDIGGAFQTLADGLGDCGGEDNQPSDCSEAETKSTEAKNAYDGASDENYSAFCLAYKSALQNQINLCGDDDGALQTIVTGLGDCTKTNTGGGTSDGDYWPMSIGNSWVYNYQVTGQSDQESAVEIKDLVDYKGVLSYSYENFLGITQATDGTTFENLEVDYYTRKSDGIYEVFVGELTAELTGLYKITQEEYDYIILKDNVDVGTKWNYNFNVSTSYKSLAPGGFDIPDVVTGYDMEFEILEKDASVVSGGTTYNSVIKVKFTQEVTVLGGFSTGVSKAEYIYSFAKDIGIVKIEGTIFDADDNITSNINQEIKSYVLK